MAKSASRKHLEKALGTTTTDAIAGLAREVAEEVITAYMANEDNLQALRNRLADLVDPGLGFGKGDHAANVELVARSGDLSRALGRPVLVGPSRKRFVARITGSAERAALDAGTVGACLAACTS